MTTPPLSYYCTLSAPSGMRLLTAPDQTAAMCRLLRRARRVEIMVIHVVGMTNIQFVMCHVCPTGVLVGKN